MSLSNPISPGAAPEPDPLIGLVARFTVLAGLPHSEPPDNEFHRSYGNGSFRLTLLAPRDVGLPYGRIPRLILSHITTMAVRQKSPELVLAPTLRSFCGILGVPATGGQNGYLQQVKRQLLKLAQLTLRAHWEQSPGKRSSDPEEERIYPGYGYPLCSAYLFPWGERTSSGPVFLRLSDEAFRLVSHKPVPVSFETLKRLQSPMAMDIYVFCTWRAIRALKRGRPEAVSWLELQSQLGSDYRRLRDFRSRFITHLKTVLQHYPDIRVEATAETLVVHAYQPHIARRLADLR